MPAVAPVVPAAVAPATIAPAAVVPAVAPAAMAPTPAAVPAVAPPGQPLLGIDLEERLVALGHFVHRAGDRAADRVQALGHRAGLHGFAGVAGNRLGVARCGAGL